MKRGLSAIASLVAMLVIGCAGEGTGDVPMPGGDPASDAGAMDSGPVGIRPPTEGPGDGGMAIAQPPVDNESCIPDRSEFETEVGPILDQRCGDCHGATTDFGAPFSLVTYDDVTAVDPAGRRSDRILTQLGAGSMPPPGNIRPTPTEHDTVVSWASCGQEMPTYPTGLVASQPVFEAPETTPVGTELVKMTVDNVDVNAGTKDRYSRFQFGGVVDKRVFIRRINVEIDKTRVVHHVTLHFADTSDNYLYAWAPGTGAVEFSDGGLAIDQDTQFRLEIHYNNLTERDEVDSSGVRLWVSEPQGKEYAMLDPSTFSISVPPMSKAEAVVICTADNDFTLLAGMPHMHEIGDTFLHTMTRADTGETETIIELSGWSFDLQFFYSLPFEVQAGDSMTIRCGYQNDTDETVRGGVGTGNEMCYNFMYVTPANGSLSCASQR